MDFDFNTSSNKYTLQLKLNEHNVIVNKLVNELNKLDNIYEDEIKKIRKKYLNKKKELINKASIKYNTNNNNINNIIKQSNI
tara:strand:- start:285 stop:530 length:246 start_codon:yes stop_codon:yes gene_type:complete